MTYSPRHTDSLPPGHTGPGCSPWVCRSTCSRPCPGCRRGCAVTSPRGWPLHRSPGRHRPPATAGSWCQHRDCHCVSWSSCNWEHRTGSARMREYLISSSPIIRLFHKELWYILSMGVLSQIFCQMGGKCIFSHFKLWICTSPTLTWSYLMLGI